jgi:hypothetical protein
LFDVPDEIAYFKPHLHITTADIDRFVNALAEM